MDNSAFEALKIGTYIFVFMIAVSASFALMGTINDMIEFTKSDISSSAEGNLIETLGDTLERTFTGTEILSIYGQKLAGELPNTLEIDILAGERYNIEKFVTNYINAYLNKTFELRYENENKWLFVKQ